jgi:uncharacterized membrane protein
MRQLQIHVPAERVEELLAIAERHHARSPFLAGRDLEKERNAAVVFLNLPNDRVGDFLDEVRKVMEETRFTLLPIGSLAIEPPLDKVEEPVRDVSSLSPAELVLSSLQSVGSWKGMLLYSLFSGVVGAYGIIFNASYLLVAAMLINPMGAPAMVSVIGLSVGDLRIFGRGGLRFFVSLLVQAATAAALGYLYGLDFSTATMEQIAGLSVLAAGLAAVAGAAGAQSQIQSERDSLVSGTAAGFMVAAALAPPAAVLGLSVPLGRWDYAGLMAFLLLVQFVAIGLGGWLVLSIFGVRPASPALPASTSGGVRTALAAGLAVLVAAAVLWQRGQEPRFLKGDLSRDAVSIARHTIREIPGAGLIEASARFSRSDLDRQPGEVLIVQVLVERLADAASTRDELETQIRSRVEHDILASMRRVVPFVDVTVLPPAP